MRVMPEEKFGLTLEKGQKQQTELNFLGRSFTNIISQCVSSILSSLEKKRSYKTDFFSGLQI